MNKIIQYIPECIKNIDYKDPKILGIVGGSLLALYLGKKHFEGGVCRIRKDLTGKIVIITGANTGIGKESATMLAQMGATVIMACRNAEKTAPAVEEVKRESGSKKVFFMKLDLSDLNQVKEFATEFNKKYDKLDILLNNAGIMMIPTRTLSKDGYEMQFATNHLGHFYLTNLLIDHLKKSGGDARVVNVSSLGHNFSKMRFEDLNREKTSYNDVEVYGQSKLANIIFAKELQRRYGDQGITSVSLHPGAVLTELGRNMSFIYKLIMTSLIPIRWYFWKTPRQGAQTNLYCCIQDKEKLQGGAYYADCKEAKTSKEALNSDDWKKLWEMSEKLINDKIPNAFK